MYDLWAADPPPVDRVAGLLCVRLRLGDRGCPVIEPTDEMIERAGRAMFGERPLNPIRRRHLGLVVAAVLAVAERNEVRPLRDLLAQLVDEDPCWLDHNGYCQAHGLHSPPCPHEVAKELLGGPS